MYTEHSSGRSKCPGEILVSHGQKFPLFRADTTSQPDNMSHRVRHVPVSFRLLCHSSDVHRFLDLIHLFVYHLLQRISFKFWCRSFFEISENKSHFQIEKYWRNLWDVFLGLNICFLIPLHSRGTYINFTTTVREMFFCQFIFAYFSLISQQLTHFFHVLTWKFQLNKNIIVYRARMHHCTILQNIQNIFTIYLSV